MANNVLFIRGDKYGSEEDGSLENETDVWDDTALIEAYDQGVVLAHKLVQQELEDEKRSDTSRGRRSTSSDKVGTGWQVGDNCRAVYSADGIVYEATVVRVSPKGDSCTVQFIGYENEEEVQVSSLLPSAGKVSRGRQMEEAQATEGYNKTGHTRNRHPSGTNSRRPHGGRINHEGVNRTYQAKHPINGSMPSFPNVPFPQSSHGFIPPLIPPPLPQLVSQHTPDDSEALSAMLMSWYMSGYHTGYYHGLKQGKTESSSLPTRNM